MRVNVAAVIVTYNRIELLKKCVSAVLSQSYEVNRLIVVNNNSNDGTEEYLSILKSSVPSICCINTKKNIGGAGGFARGIETAISYPEVDAVWLMDDDGMPKSDALLNLVKFYRSDCLLNSVVLDIKNHSNLAFPISFQNNLVESMGQLKSCTELIKDEAAPFNSTFVPTKIVKAIGVPCSHYFIWGDESEYLLRVRENNFQIFTVRDSLHYHPRKVSSQVKVLFGLFGKTDPKKDWKYYWYVRNRLDFYPKYLGLTYTVKWFLKEFIKNLLTISIVAVKCQFRALLSAIYYSVKKDNEQYAKF